MSDKGLPALSDVGVMDNNSIPLGAAALALSASYQSGRSMQRYLHHIKQLGEEVAERFAALIEAGATDDASTRLAALKHVLSDTHGYTGNHGDYDNLDNADLACVIDNGKGLPIALAILYIEAARGVNEKGGWDVYALNMPGHVLCRIDHGAQRIIFDPFEDCKVMEAPDIRNLLKKILGPQAELSSAYYEPSDKRDILIRLQNNIKLRLIEREDYEAALHVVENMIAIAPDEFRLDLDAGVLFAKTEQPQAAMKHLQSYIDQAPHDRDRHDAALLLQQIRDTLN